MELDVLLRIILYFLGSALLVVMIIIGVKFIIIMNRISSIVDDVDQKIKKLNSLFQIVDTVTDRLSLISDRALDIISGIMGKLFKNKKNDREDKDYYE